MRTTEVRRRRRGKQPSKREQGFAMLLALIALAVLAILVTDLHEVTGMSFTAATAERDQLRAEFLAKSGMNLTRMLIGQEKNLRATIGPIYQLALGRPPPQMPVWRFADILLKPFADFSGAREDVASSGVDIEHTEGLGDVHGTFSIQAQSENGKVNLNDPRLGDIASSQINVAGMLYALVGGYQQSPQKYDPLFSHLDEKGRVHTRMDLVNNMMDFWDTDTARANFDPTANLVASQGAEDTDFYRDQPEPYLMKNAPFDTLEEVRLVNGVTDDIWATFFEPDPNDPSTRQVSIYGQTRLNPNEAEPSVLLARVCSFAELRAQPLCGDTTGMEQMKFINVISMTRMLANGIPWFSRASDFMSFIQGQGSLYSMLATMMGGGSAGGGGLAGSSSGSMLFTPAKITDDNLNQAMRKMFATSGYLFTIEVTGESGISQRRIRAVINTDSKWTPPKPNAGKLPPLGVYAYYRID